MESNKESIELLARMKRNVLESHFTTDHQENFHPEIELQVLRFLTDKDALLLNTAEFRRYYTTRQLRSTYQIGNIIATLDTAYPDSFNQGSNSDKLDLTLYSSKSKLSEMVSLAQEFFHFVPTLRKVV